MIIKQELNIIDFVFRKWSGDALSSPFREVYYWGIGYSVVSTSFYRDETVVSGYLLRVYLGGSSGAFRGKSEINE